MKKGKKNNKFDNLVERLIDEFAKIPNFDLTSTDQAANRLFNIITFRIAEISSYKDLVCTYFIPTTNKLIFEGRKDFQDSKYRHLLSTTDLDFRETLYDTIRLSYVGLFHKLENYINDVIKLPDLVFGEIYETDEPVVKQAKEKFNFDIKDWHQFYITHKINWICNCVKHKDGFPLKEPKPTGFQNIDITKRIRIEADEFKRDCDHLIKFYPIYIQTIFLFAQHKAARERPILKEDYTYSPDLYDKQIEDTKKMDELVQNYVDKLKSMK